MTSSSEPMTEASPIQTSKHAAGDEPKKSPVPQHSLRSSQPWGSKKTANSNYKSTISSSIEEKRRQFEIPRLNGKPNPTSSTLSSTVKPSSKDDSHKVSNPEVQNGGESGSKEEAPGLTSDPPTDHQNPETLARPSPDSTKADDRDRGDSGDESEPPEQQAGAQAATDDHSDSSNNKEVPNDSKSAEVKGALSHHLPKSGSAKDKVTYKETSDYVVQGNLVKGESDAPEDTTSTAPGPTSPSLLAPTARTDNQNASTTTAVSPTSDAAASIATTSLSAQTSPILDPKSPPIPNAGTSPPLPMAIRNSGPSPSSTDPLRRSLTTKTSPSKQIKRQSILLSSLTPPVISPPVSPVIKSAAMTSNSRSASLDSYSAEGGNGDARSSADAQNAPSASDGQPPGSRSPSPASLLASSSSIRISGSADNVSAGQLALPKRAPRSRNPRLAAGELGATAAANPTSRLPKSYQRYTTNTQASSIGISKGGAAAYNRHYATPGAKDSVASEDKTNTQVVNAAQSSPPSHNRGRTMSADDDTSMSAADRQRSKRENHFADSLRRKSEAKPSVSSDTAASEPNLVAAAAISASSAAAGGGDNSAILAGHARSPSVNSFMSTFGGGSRSAGPSRAGFFASVTSFFNRNSTSTMAPDAHSDAHGSEPLTPAEDMLLAQLEAQNSVIAKDPKACMYPAELFKQQLDNARKEVEGTPEEGEIDWEFWYQLAGDFDGTVRKESRKLVQQVHRGLPACIRGPVWYLLCRTGCSPELDEEYQSYKEQKSPFEKLIRQDVKRTLRNIDLYSEEDGAGQQALFNVLKAYSLHDTEVGYCQGLSYVVGPLLLNMSEVEAFRVLVKLMDNYKLRGYFTPSMENLRQTLYQFERLFGEQLPLLFNHFRSQNITSTMYASQWFMTLFACRLPIELVTRVYDVVIAEGIESLLRFALTLLRRSQTHLMTLGFDEIIKFLNSESLFDYYTARNPNEFVQDAARVTSVSVQRLRRLAEEYHRVNQSGLDDERYLDVLNEKNRVLERENSHLLAKLQDLSLEHSDLTSQLVQVRKEHEELAGLVQELRKQLLIEREEAKRSLQTDMEDLAAKNHKLVKKNQELQDYSQDIEAELIRFKTMYAQSEGERDVLTKKLDTLRKALSQ